MHLPSLLGLRPLISLLFCISALQLQTVHSRRSPESAIGSIEEEPAHASSRIRKRQLQKLTAENNKNIEYQLPCKGPGGRDGHCKHLMECLIPEFTENYVQNIQHFCVIGKNKEFYAGVCCPDDANPSKTIDAPVIKPPSKAIDAPVIKPDEMKRAPAPVKLEESRFCGVNGKKFDRVGESREATYNDWPWMVALMKYKPYKKAYVHFCGAVLIDNKHVLSAAHCFNTMKPEDTVVRLGAYDFKNTSAAPYADYKVAKGMSHRDYDKATNENDIILLKLERPVQFNKMTRPICMPHLEPHEDIVNKTAIVVGWGATSFGGPASSLLLQVGIPIWDHETCKDLYTQPIPDTTVCASGYEGGKDACQGDSGGPLLQPRKDGKWSVKGIVSWGIGCAQKNKPGIYTRVTSFLPWIQRAAASLA